MAETYPFVAKRDYNGVVDNRRTPFTVALGLSLVAVAVAARVGAVPKITVSESLRHETMTKGPDGEGWTTTQTAYRTKLNVGAELPTNGERIDGETPVTVKVGDFSFEGRLKDDPSFKPGATSARLVRTSPADGKGVRNVLAKIDLKWTDERVTIKIVADSPNGLGGAAMSFLNGQIGPFEALTKTSISFGGQTLALDVPIKGKVGRKTVDAGFASGAVTTVDLKGEAKGS